MLRSASTFCMTWVHASPTATLALMLFGAVPLLPCCGSSKREAPLATIGSAGAGAPAGGGTSGAGQAAAGRGTGGKSATGGAEIGGAGPTHGGAPAVAGTPGAGGISAAAGHGNAAGAGESMADGGASVGGAGEAGRADSSGGDAGQPNVPGHDDLIVRSSVMSEYEGLTVFATYDHNTTDPSRSDPRWDTISNGSFELKWVKGFDRDTFGAYVVLFVDENGDALCTLDTDPAWVSFADNDFSMDQPVILDFDPNATSGFLESITCDQFNSWFDEDYRPPAP